MTDWAVVLATFLGPLLAVQAQKWIERSRERREEKLRIFRVLMANRAGKAGSVDYVQALNSIDLFFDASSRKEKLVTNAWDIYRDHLGNLRENEQDPNVIRLWTDKGNDLLVDLLESMSAMLGYSFSRTQISKGFYFPRGHGEEASDQFLMRKNLLAILSGTQSLPVDIRSATSDQELATERRAQ